jgi:carbonic anhydrase/acetyltransferase-like protein (isoleucine patch superfamily)
MLLKNYQDKKPVIHGGFVAEDVSVIGDVEIGENASIWYGVVLRGDVDKIVIGDNTSIQDNAVAHCSTGNPTVIGKNCVVGHNAIIHSCVVEEDCLIGMGAVLLDGCKIGKGSIVAAGCVVSPNKEIPPGSMVMGVPGRVVRQLTEKDLEGTRLSVGHYIAYAEAQLPKYCL